MKREEPPTEVALRVFLVLCLLETRPRLLENRELAADAETLNKSLITLWTAILQIIEQLSTPGHHREQTALGMMVLLVCLEMLR